VEVSLFQRQSLVLFIGSKEISLSGNFEVISLTYTPSINQLRCLAPEVVIFDLRDSAEDVFALMNECQNQEQYLLLCISDDMTAPGSIKTLNTQDLADNKLQLLLENSIQSNTEQVQIWQQLDELRRVQQMMGAVTSLQQEISNKSLETELLTIKLSESSKKINLLKIFHLSASHLGVLLSSALSTDHHTIAFEQGLMLGNLQAGRASYSSMLWYPEKLIASMDDLLSFYSDKNISLYYGVYCVTTGELDCCGLDKEEFLSYLQCEVKPEYSQVTLENCQSVKNSILSKAILSETGQDSREELDRAIEELYEQSFLRIKHSQDVNIEVSDQFDLCWWLTEKAINISVRLPERCLLWSYQSQDPRDLDFGHELLFFFDEVCSDRNGSELSISKNII